MRSAERDGGLARSAVTREGEIGEIESVARDSGLARSAVTGEAEIGEIDIGGERRRLGKISGWADQGAFLPRSKWKNLKSRGIGEVILTPYDFSAITGSKLGGERIKVNDFITSSEIKSLLGVMPSKMKSKNVSLMWLYTNIESCKIVVTGTRMFMLLFIGTLLCPNLGSIVSLRYLWSLRDIGQIKNYDWVGMAYMYEYFGVGPQVLEDVGDMYPMFLHWLPKYRLSTLPKHSLQAWRMVIDNLIADDMSLDPWLGCEERAKCEWAQELNSRQVLSIVAMGDIGILFYASSSEKEAEEEVIPPPSHIGGSSSSFMVTYSHFLSWQYEVMNPDGSYSSVNLDWPVYTPNVP
ncbi:hypothetical protein SO802_026860 [Lithocarpus litseifolius]|uniref:Aminotransferase-like plant mobile domain-containing protein n=1 Tax=Lithocarpus litseifolius TaxID=425828 RepID=A0AAW2C686_9ROSI